MKIERAPARVEVGRGSETFAGAEEGRAAGEKSAFTASWILCVYIEPIRTQHAQYTLWGCMVSSMIFHKIQEPAHRGRGRRAQGD